MFLRNLVCKTFSLVEPKRRGIHPSWLNGSNLSRKQAVLLCIQDSHKLRKSYHLIYWKLARFVQSRVIIYLLNTRGVLQKIGRLRNVPTVGTFQ